MPIETPTAAKGMDRRRFLTAASGAFVLGFVLPPFTRSALAADGTVDAQTLAGAVPSTAVNAWIRIGTDESITILIGSSEMGQGIMTGLAQIVAEDLMANWANVRAVEAPAAPAYNNPLFGGQFTGGSSSVRGYYQALRSAGAAARDMLIAAAARTWGVSASACQAVNGTVVLRGTSRVLTYGQLASLAATMPVPSNPQLVPDSALRLIGQPLQRLDWTLALVQRG